MITQERFDRVKRMLLDRADYWESKNKEQASLAAATAMTAYHSAYMMLYCAEQGYDEELAQFNYYDKED